MIAGIIELFDRNFLIDYPPYYNIVYPQNTSMCVAVDTDKVLDNPELNQKSLAYWERYNKNIHCEGVPTEHGSPYYGFQKKIAQCKMINPSSRPASNPSSRPASNPLPNPIPGPNNCGSIPCINPGFNENINCIQAADSRSRQHHRQHIQRK